MSAVIRDIAVPDLKVERHCTGGSTQVVLSITVNAPGPAPTVSAISPTSGAMEGGTSVTLTGTDFAAGATVTVTNTGSQSGSKASAFTYNYAPSVISSSYVKLWLKADAITGPPADGASVTTWNDSSSTANHVTQATADLRPTYKTGIVNGKPVVRFDGTQRMSKSYVAGVSAYTLFLVAKNADNHPGGYGVPLSLGSVYQNTLRTLSASGNILFGDFSTGETTFETVWSPPL